MLGLLFGFVSVALAAGIKLHVYIKLVGFPFLSTRKDISVFLVALFWVFFFSLKCYLI